MTKRVTATIVICVMGAIIAGIALARPGSNDPAPATAQPADTAQPGTASEGIVIDQFAFAGTMTVAPGQTVVVNNIDGAQHTLTSSDGLFDTGTLDATTGTGSFVAPTEPGTYAFFCSIHPSMTGTITVTG
jgi:plastocyanin